MCLFFFFKQKTAYEMRISDWSSDVCSSDLVAAQTTPRAIQSRPIHKRQTGRANTTHMGARLEPEGTPNMATTRARPMTAADSHAAFRHIPLSFQRARIWSTSHKPTALREYIENSSIHPPLARSEEHTSELKSLMRLAYSV